MGSASLVKEEFAKGLVLIERGVRCSVWWYMPTIPATWKAQAGGSWFRVSWGKVSTVL
jgi:hypothetical protein